MTDEDKTRLLEDEEVELDITDDGADGNDSNYIARPKPGVLAFLRQNRIRIALLIAFLTTVAAISTPLLLLRKSATMKSLSHLVIIGDSYSVDGCEDYMDSPDAMRSISQMRIPRCPPFAENRTDRYWFHSWVQYLQYDQDHAISNEHIKNMEIISMAKGGASCDREIFKNIPMGAKEQFSKFKDLYKNFGSTAGRMPFPVQSTALVLFFGVNDMTSIEDGHGSIDDLVACVSRAADEGYAYGFRHIVIMQTPAREKMPYQIKVDELSGLIKNYMEGERRMVATLRRRYRDARFYHFPTYEVTSAIVASPAQYGFLNPSARVACGRCEKPFDRIWNDWYHASSPTMHILSRKFTRFLVEGRRGERLYRGTEGVQ